MEVQAAAAPPWTAANGKVHELVCCQERFRRIDWGDRVRINWRELELLRRPRPGSLTGNQTGEPDYFFHNPTRAEKYYNDFSKRKVMLGRKVDVESLLKFEIERPFLKQGWRNLLDMGTEVFPKYVRLFFANLTVGWEAGGLFTAKSTVGGQDIILNEVILGDILGIAHVGIRAYEFKTWPVCKGFDYREALVYLLGNGMAEDVPRKIHANQLSIRSSSRERDSLTKCEHFNATVLTRMGYRRTSRNTWVPKRQDSDEDEGDAVAEAEDEP
ncbi:hypothetical protein CJ030_MR4G013728 [Morella rubra]|uniref:Uncharacterized protein n=1 Tax=Morella rubra TaxID=262757 RepID=A0A6A1WTQ0_9ROSI|nr:hypothetical protein CJ030_MR4G013728 [Morella rubra]